MKGQNNNLNQAYIPSLEEMKSWYRDDLLKEALKSLECGNSKKIEEQGSFFKAFRRFEETDDRIAFYPKKDNIYYEKYKVYVEEERANMAKRIEIIENLIQYEKFFLRFERRTNSESNNYSHYGSNSATRYRVDCIKKLERELGNLLESSPEAWEFYHKRQLIIDIENQRQQRLITVPYVVKAKQKIIDSLNMGLPVYIVGHLGSGKTQLAIEAARKALAVTLLSIDDFNRYLKSNAEQLNQKVEVISETWFFGSKYYNVKEFNDKNVREKDKGDIIRSIVKLDATDGATDDASCLRQILSNISSIQESELKKGKQIKIVFEITDGASSFPGATKESILELLSKNVEIYAFQIGKNSETSKKSFNFVWNEGYKKPRGVIIGEQVEKLPKELLRAMGKNLESIFNN